MPYIPVVGKISFCHMLNVHVRCMLVYVSAVRGLGKYPAAVRRTRSVSIKVVHGAGVRCTFLPVVVGHRIVMER